MEKEEAMFTRILARIENWVFQRGVSKSEQSPDTAIKLQQEDLEETLDGEVVHSISTIDLVEQLYIIQTVKDYMRNYVASVTHTDPEWTSGYALQNELFVTNSEEIMYRCNMEVFFQEKDSGYRKLVFMVSLIKFHSDSWKVFQIKERSLEVISAYV
jgi:hypothetical protein